MPWWNYALLGGVFLVVILIIRRIWPVIHGTARSGDTRAERMNRWNTYLVPMIRQHLEERYLVGLAGRSRARRKGVLMVGTWSLMPTLLPDVDYITLSQLVKTLTSLR